MRIKENIFIAVVTIILADFYHFPNLHQLWFLLNNAEYIYFRACWNPLSTSGLRTLSLKFPVLQHDKIITVNSKIFIV